MNATDQLSSDIQAVYDSVVSEMRVALGRELTIPETVEAFQASRERIARTIQCATIETAGPRN